MFKRIVSIALSSGLTLAAASAFAAGFDYPTNPEHSFTSQPAPTPKTRAEVLREAADFRASPVSPDGWQYVGGERDWTLIPHQFAFFGGNVVHVDHLAHNAPRANRQMSSAEQSESRILYKNAL